MNNNIFSNWKILCEKERLKKETEAQRAIAILEQELQAKLCLSKNNLNIRDSSTKLKIPLVTSFLTPEQVINYLVNKKIT